MPEARLTNARKTLPDGYQFGDAGMIQRLAAVILAETGLPLSEVSRIAPSIAQHWNVIEGDHA